MYHCVCVPIGDGWPKESTTVAGEATDGTDGTVYDMAADRRTGCGDQKPFDIAPHSTHADIKSEQLLFSIPTSVPI